MGSVGESRQYLGRRKGVLLGHGLHRFTCREGPDNRGDIDPCARDARLAESDIGIHRDAGEDFHTELECTTKPTKDGPLELPPADAIGRNRCGPFEERGDMTDTVGACGDDGIRGVIQLAEALQQQVVPVSVPE
jgi:hypothetical protein